MEELSTPLGAADTGRLIFTHGAAHLTIRMDGCMDDLYQAKYQGKLPEIRVAGGTVTVKHHLSLHPARGEITLAGCIPWAVEAHAGMSDVTANLEGLELTGWRVTAGARRARPGAHRPGGSKLAIDGFRGSGRIDWQSLDYDRLEDRYDIQIGAGASNLTVRT